MVEDLPADSWPVAASAAEQFRNWLITVRTDKVRLPDEQHAERTVVTHIGAVAILALDDARPGAHDPPVPAPGGPACCGRSRPGCATSTGEALVRHRAARAARGDRVRRAASGTCCVDSYASPGITSERIRIFLARGAEQAAESGYQREGEEKFLRADWVPLTEAVRAALAGKLHNGATIQGVLAGYVASSEGFSGLRPADAPESHRSRARRAAELVRVRGLDGDTSELMKVGVPREVKNHEYRVAITPGGRARAGPRRATRCSSRRARARARRCRTRSSPRRARRSCRPPTTCGARPTWCSRSRSRCAEEYHRMRPGQVLFTYLHLAASRECTDALLTRGVTAIAYETVQLARRLAAAARARCPRSPAGWRRRSARTTCSATAAAAAC